MWVKTLSFYGLITAPFYRIAFLWDLFAFLLWASVMFKWNQWAFVSHFSQCLTVCHTSGLSDCPGNIITSHVGEGMTRDVGEGKVLSAPDHVTEETSEAVCMVLLYWLGMYTLHSHSCARSSVRMRFLTAQLSHCGHTENLTSEWGGPREPISTHGTAAHKMRSLCHSQIAHPQCVLCFCLRHDYSMSLMASWLKVKCLCGPRRHIPVHTCLYFPSLSSSSGPVCFLDGLHYFQEKSSHSVKM